MRLPVLVCAVLLTACGAGMRTQSDRAIYLTLGVPSDSALNAATRQLAAHGFDVHRAGETTIVTAPQAAPAYTRPLSTAAPSDTTRWMVMVSTEPATLFHGSRLVVTGYIMPPAGAAQVSPGNAVQQQAIPITSDDRQLFARVQQVADWISAATKRP